ncbi:MAG: hypothetical protein CL549_11475 [Alcanivorax sp.]|nr:hypothetical protein [Alcanivorax sp.]MAY11090.1 hypothetical protein [Alcanivorax sp.]MBI53032.1 hypothetical protein [Alcanivorax sp.]
MNHFDTCRMTPNLFIIGMPRSGTKLFRALLNNHPRIFIPHIETAFIPTLIKGYGCNELTKVDAKKIVDEIKNSLFFVHYLENNDFDFSVLKHKKNMPEVLNAFYSQLFSGAKDDLSYIGDKSPNNIEDVALLMDFFPKAKFIHIVRDPRDYALSVKNAWNKSIIRSVIRWVDGVGRVAEVANKHPERIIEVRYEDLIESPGEVLKKCVGFLELNYFEEMIGLDKVVENYGDARGKEISSNNKNKYKSKMKARLLSRIDDCAVELLERYNYSCGSKRRLNKVPPRLLVSVLSIYDAVNMLIFSIKKWGFFKVHRGFPGKAALILRKK